MPTSADRQNISSASPYEDVIGFSRAVRVGPYIHVSGTTAIGDDGELVGVNNLFAQTVQTLRNIESALAEAGATLDDVVRTRIYIRKMDHWKHVAEAHSAVFDLVRPAATIVEVSRFIDPRMLIEIEADAYIGEAETN